MDKILETIFNKNKPRRLSPKERARIAFEKRAKEQFLRLKKRGLSIPVISL